MHFENLDMYSTEDILVSESLAIYSTRTCEKIVIRFRTPGPCHDAAKNTPISANSQEYRGADSVNNAT